GLYGVVATAVSQRRREMGIRMALGADRASVIARTLRRGMVPVALGLATRRPGGARSLAALVRASLRRGSVRSGDGARDHRSVALGGAGRRVGACAARGARRPDDRPARRLVVRRSYFFCAFILRSISSGGTSSTCVPI